jgi:hypothetical protein
MITLIASTIVLISRKANKIYCEIKAIERELGEE